MSSGDGPMGYRDRKFSVPDIFRKWKSRYDFESEELQNLQQTNIKEIFTQVLDLTVAQTPQNPLQISVSGRAFKIRGIDSTQVYSFTTNTGIESVKTGAFVGCFIGKTIGGPNDAMMLKHGDGYRGDFLNLYLFWPAQAGVNARLTIYSFDDLPWIAGDPST